MIKQHTDQHVFQPEVQVKHRDTVVSGGLHTLLATKGSRPTSVGRLAALDENYILLVETGQATVPQPHNSKSHVFLYFTYVVGRS